MKFLDQEKLKVLSDEAVDRFEELIDLLGVELKKDNRMYYGPCPIHGGDRHNGFNLYHSGNSVIGNWICNTHQCQEIFRPTVIGFVRGVLSNQQCNWTRMGDKIFPFKNAVEFLLNFMGKNYEGLEVDLDAAEKRKVADFTMRFYNRQHKSITNKISRKIVRNTLRIPAEYYIKRGYTKEILNRYDIGYCNDQSKPMYDRCVVPVYNDAHTCMIGCSGRSIHDKCPNCSAYHNLDSPCPLHENKWKYCKWRHSKGFHGGGWLYNLWFAHKHILKTGCAVLVESPGNVWRLEEAGIHNSLGMFGTALSEGQLDSLHKCGAHNIVLIFDNDDAGKEAVIKTTEALDKLYNVRSIETTENDIGETSVDILYKDIVPKIEGAYVK